MILSEHALAEDRHGGADRLLLLELDREGVHRDRADHLARLAADADLGAGQVTPEPVCITHGNDPDPGRLLGDKGAPVAGAFARLELLHLREVAPPGERRLEPVGSGVLAERRQAVEGDPAAGRVEA